MSGAVIWRELPPIFLLQIVRIAFLFPPLLPLTSKTVHQTSLRDPAAGDGAAPGRRAVRRHGPPALRPRPLRPRGSAAHAVAGNPRPPPGGRPRGGAVVPRLLFITARPRTPHLAMVGSGIYLYYIYTRLQFPNGFEILPRFLRGFKRCSRRRTKRVVVPSPLSSTSSRDVTSLRLVPVLLATNRRSLRPTVMHARSIALFAIAPFRDRISPRPLRIKVLESDGELGGVLIQRRTPPPPPSAAVQSVHAIQQIVIQEKNAQSDPITKSPVRI